MAPSQLNTRTSKKKTIKKKKKKKKKCVKNYGKRIIFNT